MGECVLEVHVELVVIGRVHIGNILGDDPIAHAVHVKQRAKQFIPRNLSVHAKCIGNAEYVH